jgi:ferredoxin
MADGFAPPQGVRDNAKRGLELRREFNRGGTAVGVARARDLSNGKSLPLDTVNRMVSYFARHEVDKKGENWGNASDPSRGYIAWLLWGGDAGKTWADSIAEREKKKDKSMTTDFTHSYAAIIKQEKQEDGTLLVYGKATDDSIDIDQQICDAGWLDTAMPQWFKTGGNIREQHSNIAAGVAKELDSKPDGHYISALVVDPVSVKKVETGVLKGFSIGIRAPRIVRDQKAANGRIIDGQIVEISLVDRPANPNAKLTLAKSDNAGTLEQVEEFIEKAEQEPDYENMNRGGKGSEPSDTELYNRVKREAKAKFDVYPSAVANAWVTNEYKKRGGGYKKTEKNTATQTVKGEKMQHEEEDKAVSEKPSNEDMLKMYEEAKSSYMDAKMALDECKAMCKEAGIEIDDEDEELEKKEYGETAEEETAEGSKPEAAQEEVEEAEGKKPLDKAEKCLECGCDQPSNTHGRSDVSTAVMISPTETPKSLDTIIPRIDVDGNDIADDGTEEDSSDDEDLSNKTITAIIEKAVKSAKDAITTEVISYQEEINKLNAELATAKTKAVSGGPKRAAIKVDVQQMSELLAKAAEYRAKSSVTADKDLARGYRELASDFEAKAAVLKPSN